MAGAKPAPPPATKAPAGPQATANPPTDPPTTTTVAEEHPTTTTTAEPKASTPPSNPAPVPASTVAPSAELEAAPAPPAPDSASAVIVVGGPGPPVGPTVPPPPPAELDPHISADPDSGLVHLQEVQVSGTGYAPNESVGIAQCKAGVTDVFEGCDISRTTVSNADSNGEWSTSLSVSVRIRASAGDVVDCTIERGVCVITAVRLNGFSDLVSAPIGFDPAAEVPPPPVVTVSPSTGLAHGQQVTVSGSGFGPGATVQVIQCAADSDVNSRCVYPLATAVADDAGNISTALAVKRLFGYPGDLVIDCIDAPGCVIRTQAIGDPLGTADTKIAFDPDAPLPPRPVVSIAPDGDLVHDQQVHVTGSGFVPNIGVSLIQCSVSRDPYPACAYSTSAYVVADEAGTIDADFTVKRVVGFAQDRIVDCIDAPGCVLRAFSETDDPLASAEISLRFDPDVPLPPPPVMTIRPSQDLAHNQRVTVTGSGFAPNQFVQLYECAEKDGRNVACSYFSGPAPQTDADGAFETTFAARRLFASYPGGPVSDCLEVDHCALYAQTSYDDPLGFAEIELDFDPEAPLPPPPSITVDPSTDLQARHLIEIDGDGFAPNVSHNIVQCTSESTYFDFRCNFGPTVVADENGEVHSEATLRRYISDFPEPIDCAEPDRCMVAVFSYSDGLSFAIQPVSFDPDAPPPPRPIVTVSQSSGLSNDQTITLTGSGFSPFASVGFGQCHAGADGPEDCEASTTRYAAADADGSFTAEFVVRERIERPVGGTLDCTTGPGVCILGIANVSDWSESSEPVPLSFGGASPPEAGGVGGGDPGPPAASAPTPASAARTPRLAFTGTPVAGYLEFAALSIGLGALMVVASRRRAAMHR